MGAPRRRPTAIRVAELVIFRPTLESGNAASQSPEPSAREARSRALSDGVEAAANISSASVLQQGSSQARWADEGGGTAEEGGALAGAKN